MSKLVAAICGVLGGESCCVEESGRSRSGAEVKLIAVAASPQPFSVLVMPFDR